MHLIVVSIGGTAFEINPFKCGSKGGVSNIVNWSVSIGHIPGIVNGPVLPG
jgi:hypothetical protein